MAATTAEDVSVQYRAQAIEELRVPILRSILWSVLVGAWAVTLPFPMPSSDPALALCIVASLLVFLCLPALGRWYALSAGLFLAGMAVLGVAAMQLYPQQPIAYFLSLLVACAVLIANLWAGAAVALAITAALVGQAWWHGAAALPAGAVNGLALSWLTLWVVWRGMQPMSTLVAWSWHSYNEARQKAAELQERQARLAQVLKDLDNAYNELARANEKLALSKAVAEEARRAKAEFVANVSHELRTPINMIIGFTEMIVRAPRTYARNGLPPALLADLDVVLRNAQHLSDLINDILDLSQLDVGRMGLVKEWASMAEIAEAAVEAIRPLAEARGLPIHLEVEPGLPPVLVDRTRIRQVLLNLLSNAVRFTERGEIRVAVARRGSHIVASVSDTGPGVAAEDIPRMFEPFHQLDGSIRRRYGGTGLGLHISRSFVTLHGGEMAVESEVGRGTTIYFTLPIEDTVPFSALEHSPATATSGNGSAYIVTEPRPVVEGLLRRYIDDGTVIPAPSLEAAVKLSRTQPTSAIVVRANHAQELWQLLEEAGRMAYDAPLIACSMPGALEAYSEELGLAGYLLKPLARRRLLDTLSALPNARTLLIIDDDRDFLRLFARMVKSARREYTVWQATSAEEGLALASECHPDAIFLDVLLPDLVGPQLVARIRAQESLRDVPVFFVTAQDASGSPLVANLIAITHRGGLSADELMRCVQAAGRALRGAIPPADRGSAAAPPG